MRFEVLPEDLEDLADQIYGFCPDVIDGDLEDENAGLERLQRALHREQQIGLWWDSVLSWPQPDRDLALMHIELLRSRRMT